MKLLFCALVTRAAAALEVWQIAWGAASDCPKEVIWGIVGLLLEATLHRATRQWQRRAFRTAGMAIALADAVRLVWQGGPWWAWVAAAGGIDHRGGFHGILSGKAQAHTLSPEPGEKRGRGGREVDSGLYTFDKDYYQKHKIPPNIRSFAPFARFFLHLPIPFPRDVSRNRKTVATRQPPVAALIHRTLKPIHFPSPPANIHSPAQRAFRQRAYQIRCLAEAHASFLR